MALDEGPLRVYRPALLSRRGEITAWILAIVASISYLIYQSWSSSVQWTAGVFVGLLILAGASISLGNWMDRRTMIRVDQHGLDYRNGLRHAKFTWGEIKEVQVSPGRFGDQVHVIGDHSHFHFRLHADVQYQGEVRGQLGFPEGEEILALILARSGLSLKKGGSPIRYYARQ